MNPSLEVARRWYSNALAWTGDGEAALREAQLAYDLDPGSSLSRHVLGSRLQEMQRYEAAIEQFLRAIDIDPESYPSHFALAWTYSLANRHDDALAAARKLQQLSPARLSTLMLAYVDARAGRRSEAAAKLAELHASAPGESDPLAPNLAHVYMALGDRDRALSLLEAAFRDNPGRLVSIDTSPDMRPLTGDPRFQRIVQALRAPAEGSAPK